MACATANNPNRNLTTLSAVAVLHLGLVVALVNGLAGGIWKPKEEQPFEGYQIRNVNDPLPEEPKPVDQKQQQTQTTDQTEQLTLDKTPYAGDPIIPTFSTGGFGGGIREVEFPTRPVDPPLPQGFKPQGPKARGNQSLWVGTHDYPSRDMRDGHEGVTRVSLTIGLNGRVTNCAVTRSSGWPGLDEASCRKLTDRGKFDPATDETGALTTGTFTTAVRWQLPKEE